MAWLKAMVGLFMRTRKAQQNVQDTRLAMGFRWGSCVCQTEFFELSDHFSSYAMISKELVPRRLECL